MFRVQKHRARREEIRRNRPELGLAWRTLRESLSPGTLLAAVVFWVCASAICMLRDQVVRYRPGQYVRHDVFSRVAFESRNVELENELKEQARQAAPRVYRRLDGAFAAVEKALVGLPGAAGAGGGSGGAMRASDGVIRELARLAADAEAYVQSVRRYIELLRKRRDDGALIVLPYWQREADLQVPERRFAKVQGGGGNVHFMTVEVARTFARRPGEPFSERQRADLLGMLRPLAADVFGAVLAADVAALTVENLQPTHEIDEQLTRAEQKEAENIPLTAARRHIVEGSVLVPKDSYITPSLWRVLQEEQRHYARQIRRADFARWLVSQAGMAVLMLLVTLAIGVYMALYQPRVLQNPLRATALFALLAVMLLAAQVSGTDSVPLLLFGVAPTILVALTLTTVYDHRVAMGISTLHAAIVTLVLGQEVTFFLTIWLGLRTVCFLLDEVRTRGKLIEVSAATALVMAGATAALGAVAADPVQVVASNCLHAGAAGLSAGFIMLGVLPFVERAFGVTTAMTLLEVADVSHPLLRRLSIEAPGTYAHSFQVATLAEAAADAIGADSLLCRVGSYFHDIGKMLKAEYFCENQFDGANRHVNLAPSVSMLVIASHVKDGVELAREYNLPPVLFQFIQQHHGTTIVEHFYQEACRRQEPAEEARPAVSDTEYRYAGPRPQSRESAVVMIADAVESAARAMVEPNAARIETLVHELITRRLLDGQFGECDITMGELERVEKALVKTLLSIYHGRLTYPSTAATTGSRGASVVNSA